MWIYNVDHFIHRILTMPICACVRFIRKRNSIKHHNNWNKSLADKKIPLPTNGMFQYQFTQRFSAYIIFGSFFLFFFVQIRGIGVCARALDSLRAIFKTKEKQEKKREQKKPTERFSTIWNHFTQRQCKVRSNDDLQWKMRSETINCLRSFCIAIPFFFSSDRQISGW